jgi:hypothetical protein
MALLGRGALTSMHHNVTARNRAVHTWVSARP